MTRTVDLNQLRQTLVANQQQRPDVPADRAAKIFVSREGQILRGADLAPGEHDEPLAEVHQGVFAGWLSALTTAAKVAVKYGPIVLTAAEHLSEHGARRHRRTRRPMRRRRR